MFRTQHLVIIAGPSCAGKSFLIEKIRRGDCAQVSEKLGMSTPSQWPEVHAIELAGIDQPLERLLVHYDFYAQRSENGGSSHRV